MTDVYDYVAEVGYAMSSAARVRVMDAIIAKGAASGVELRDATGLSKSSLSQHMGALRRVGMVRETRKGRLCIYSVGVKDAIYIYESMRALVRNLLENLPVESASEVAEPVCVISNYEGEEE